MGSVRSRRGVAHAMRRDHHHPAFWRREAAYQRALRDRVAADTPAAVADLGLEDPADVRVGFGKLEDATSIRCEPCGIAFLTATDRAYVIQGRDLDGRELRCAVCQTPLAPPTGGTR